MPITDSAQKLFRSRSCAVTYGGELANGLAVNGRLLLDSQVADLASAHDGCAVTARIEYDGVYDTVVLVSDNSPHFATPTVRRLRVTDGELIMENENFHLVAGSRGKGIAVLSLATQVRSCLKIGVRRIDLYAAGRHGAAMTGYLAWPDLGFDAEIPDWLWRRLCDPGLQNLGLNPDRPGRVSELMATNGGRNLWRHAGQALTMSMEVDGENPAVRNLLSILEERDL